MGLHVDIAAKANVSAANVRQAHASGGRRHVDVIKKDGED
jgi:hypothetical protein